MRTVLGAATMIVTLVSTAGTAQVKVAITSPVNGSHVVERPMCLDRTLTPHNKRFQPTTA